MIQLPGRRSRPPVLAVEPPKGPWSSGDDPSGTGPRNPWAVPPSGKRTGAKPSALDEFLKKARGGGGGNGGGGGFGNLPGGANARTLWAIGAGLVLVAWVGVTSIHPIGPQERGVVTYFGRYVGTLDPGIQVTLPAPIANVDKVDVQAIRTEDFPDGGGENLMLTRDQNIIDLAYSVRWSIADPVDFAFQIAEPRGTVRATAESAMREVVANVTLDEALTTGRQQIEAEVQQRMQRILDEYNAGIRIQGVGIKQADPPERVNDAFKDVTAAQQESIAFRNQAQSYAQQVIARAEGEAAQFDKVYEQYRLAPEVTRRRMYYETMEAVLARSDKTIVEPSNVVPYLSGQPARRLAEPQAQAGASGQPQAQPQPQPQPQPPIQQGAGQ